MNNKIYSIFESVGIELSSIQITPYFSTTTNQIVIKGGVPKSGFRVVDWLERHGFQPTTISGYSGSWEITFWA